MKPQRSRGPYSGAAGLVRGNRGLSAASDVPKSINQMSKEEGERVKREQEALRAARGR